MGRYIIKISDEKTNKDYYMEWSTIVDAPVTYGLELQEFKDYYRDEYGANEISALDERLKRVDTKGISAHDETLEDLLGCNRAGKKETCLTKQEILEQYCLKRMVNNFYVC